MNTKKPAHVSDLVPLLIDMRRRKVVVFGGGSVAERKARLFSGHGPVTVVSRDFTPALMEMAREGSLELVRTDLKIGDDLQSHLQGAFLVIPATSDRKLNQALEAEATKMGILVNSVDREGDVVVPSTLRKGSLVLAIATSVPALTRYLRIKLEPELTQERVQMARLLGEIREELKSEITSQSRRRQILWEVLEDQGIWELLVHDYGKAYMRAREHLKADERDSLHAGDAPKGLHRGN